MPAALSTRALVQQDLGRGIERQEGGKGEGEEKKGLHVQSCGSPCRELQPSYDAEETHPYRACKPASL